MLTLTAVMLAALPLFAEEAPRPRTPTERLFEATLGPERLGALEGNTSLDSMGGSLNGDERDDLKLALDRQLRSARDPSTLRDIGNGYVALGYPAQALELAGRLQQAGRGSEGASLTMQVAATHLNQGNRTEARAAAERAVAMDPANSVARSFLQMVRPEDPGRAAGAGRQPAAAGGAPARGTDAFAGAQGAQLSASQEGKVDQALAIGNRSGLVQTVIAYIIPWAAQKPTVSELRRGDVDVRAAPGDMNGRMQQVVPVPGRPNAYAVVVGEDVLREDPRLVAAYVAGALRQVRDARENGDKLSPVSLQQSQVLESVHATVDLAQMGENPCAGSSAPCQRLAAYVTIWRDQLAEGAQSPVPLTNPAAAQMVERAREGEQRNNQRATEALLQQVRNGSDLSSVFAWRPRGENAQDLAERDRFLNGRREEDRRHRQRWRVPAPGQR